MNHSETDVDTRMPTLERFKWPKAVPVLSPRQQARIVWIRATFDDGIRDDSAGVPLLTEVAERAESDGDTGLALKLLGIAALRCFWAQPGPEVRQRVVLAQRYHADQGRRRRATPHDPRAVARIYRRPRPQLHLRRPDRHRRWR